MYALNNIVNGNTGVYALNTMPDFIYNMYYGVEELLYGLFGIKRDIIYAERPMLDINVIKEQ